MIGWRAFPVATMALATLTASCASSHGTPSTQHSARTPRTGDAARYLAIAEPANRRLDEALDAFHDRDGDDLAAARADLRSVAATETSFDRKLLALHLPAPAGQTARNLVAVNESRAELTTVGARARSLRAMRIVRARLPAADALVETQVRILRAQLGLPPPDSS